MSFESSPESKEKVKESNSNKEHKWKELLYELFYEIKSEILGTKIEINEDEYQENVKTSTIPILIRYIHDSIQILIQKKTESISESKLEDKNNFASINDDKNNNKYIYNESYLKKLEAKERYLIKLSFQNKLQKDAIENKLNDYMDMEEEFEEMKAKLKYEDGRFLNNDRKDNEIIIIRGENSNLKKTINNLEKQMKDLNKEISEKTKLISELENEIKNLNTKMEKIQKQNEILNSHNINININNVTGTNNKNNIQRNNINNIENINQQIQGKFPNYFNCDLNTHDDNNSNKYFPYKKIKNKMMKEKKIQRDSLSNTKNELSEKTKSDYYNRYFAANKINYNKNNNLPLNYSYAKINYHPIGNSNKSNANNNIPLINRNTNYNFIKKVIFSGENTNTKRPTKNKIN